MDGLKVRLFNHPAIIKYIAYDFHEECKNNNYTPLDRLVKSIADEIHEFGFYLRDRDHKVICTQTVRSLLHNYI